MGEKDGDPRTPPAQGRDATQGHAMTAPETPLVDRGGCGSLEAVPPTKCLSVATWPSDTSTLMDPDGMTTHCPCCGKGGPVDRSTYGKSLRADAACRAPAAAEGSFVMPDGSKASFGDVPGTSG